MVVCFPCWNSFRVSRAPFWVAGLVSECIWIHIGFYIYILDPFLGFSGILPCCTLEVWKQKFSRPKVMPFRTRKKIVLQVPCWIRFGMFWDLQGSILGCVASMLDLFCVLVFNLGPILGFRGTIGAPSTPFYLLEKGCLFLDGTFSIYIEFLGLEHEPVRTVAVWPRPCHLTSQWLSRCSIST